MDGSIAIPALSRRQFIVTALTAAGGLAIGIGPAQALPIARSAVEPWRLQTRTKSTPGW